GMLTTEPPQAFQEITSQLLHSPQEALLFDDVKYFQCKAAGQRAPAERGSVLARFETLSHPGVAENGAEGISRGQRLCERQHVGYQGPESGLVVLLGSYAERAERSPVEGILEREDEGLVRFPSRARIGAGDLERRFHRLGSAVRKEDLRHPREIG